MRRLALDGSKLPEIQQLAFWLGTPAGIEQFLRTYWVIRPDPLDAEYIEAPAYQLAQWQERGYFAGDCDDASTIAATLVHSIGWPASFLAYRQAGHGEFSHVNVMVPSGLGWALDLEIDPVTPANLLPIQAEEVMEVHM